jgi:septum formation protein
VSGVILASTSAARRKLLEAAGLAIAVEPSGFDEASLKRALKGSDVGEVAGILAEHKAVAVAKARPGCWVVGADQMLDCDGRWFDKPRDRQDARRQLAALRGKAHRLVTAVAVARDGPAVWRHVDTARLVMRPFSDAFLDSYLELAGEAALSSVGAYQLEGLGVQLFSEVDGDHFTILGLPLLPLLAFLRSQGVLGT